LFLAGCGSGSKRVGVQGTVTYKGEPVKEGSITFEPFDPAQAYAE